MTGIMAAVTRGPMTISAKQTGPPFTVRTARVSIKAGTRVDVERVEGDQMFRLMRVPGWEDWSFNHIAIGSMTVRVLSPLELLAEQAP